MNDFELVRPAEAAELLGISTTTLWRVEQSDPNFPPKIRISARCVGYRRSELLTWITQREASV
jgi:prophage regulatory protein